MIHSSCWTMYELDHQKVRAALAALFFACIFIKQRLTINPSKLLTKKKFNSAELSIDGAPELAERLSASLFPRIPHWCRFILLNPSHQGDVQRRFAVMGKRYKEICFKRNEAWGIFSEASHEDVGFPMTAAADQSWITCQSARTAVDTSDECVSAHVHCAVTNTGTRLSPHSSSVSLCYLLNKHLHMDTNPLYALCCVQLSGAGTVSTGKMPL